MRGRSEPVHHLRKVRVLGHYNGIRLTGGSKSRYCGSNFSILNLTAATYTDASQVICIEILSFFTKLSPVQSGFGKIS